MMIKRLLLGLSLTVLPLSLAACGDTGGGSIALEDLADEVDEAFCEADVKCGESPDMATCLDTRYGDREDELKTISASVEAGRISYDAEQAAECLDLIRGMECRFSSTFDEAAFEAACRAVFTGTVADGGACVEDEECASQECEPPTDCTMSCCVGACVMAEPDPTPVPVGGDCSGVEAECVATAYCASDATGERCVAKVGAGQPCADFDACQQGLFCVLDYATEMGTCQELPDEGETCDPNAFFIACDRQDNYCDPTTMKCTRKKGVGEACTPTEFGDSNCQAYAACVSGTCVARPGEGEACSDTLECLGELDCDGAVCVAPADEPACPLPG